MPSKIRFAALVIVFLAALTGIVVAGVNPPPTPPNSLFRNFYCATSTTGVASTLSGCINSTIPYVLVALLLSFAIVALCYLLGEVLNIQTFKGWYRTELWEAVKSLLIVGVVFSVIVVFGEIATILPGCNCAPVSGTTSGFDYMYLQAYAYLNGGAQTTGGSPLPGVINLTNESFNMLLGASVGEEYLKSISLQTYFTIPFPPIPIEEVPVFGALDLGTTFNPFQSSVLDTGVSSSPASLLKDSLNLLVFPMMIVTGAQLYVFTALIQIGLGILLPLGLVFRATPFLRGIGGTLIALAIGAVIVYPALLAMFDLPISIYFYPLYPSSTYGSSPSCPDIVGFCAFYQTALNPATLLLSGLPQFSNPYENDYGAFSAGDIGATNAFFNGNLSPLLSPLFTYLVPVVINFILFVMNLIMGIIIVTNVAKVLGGNLRLGIGKLSLV